MKTAFVDIADPTDAHTWSGITSRMIDGFTAQSEIVVISKLGAGIRPMYMGHKLLYRMAGQRFDEQRTRFSLDMYSARLRSALAGCGVDAVIAPGSLPVAHLDYGK